MAMAATAARAGENRFRSHHLRSRGDGRSRLHPRHATVATIADLIAEGSSVDEVLADYPYLERVDVRQALAYAAWLARDEVAPA
jgi:uncharacterized protein (DUF433 family)